MIGCNIDFNLSSKQEIHSFLVGILGTIVTLLIGWNIYTVIDYNVLSRKLERELNYAHNKMDVNKADTYSFLCQQCVVSFSSCSQELSKFRMICFGLNAIKIYSSTPGCEREMDDVCKSLEEGLKASNNIKLSESEIDEILLTCGSIPAHKRNAIDVQRIINLIKN